MNIEYTENYIKLLENCEIYYTTELHQKYIINIDSKESYIELLKTSNMYYNIYINNYITPEKDEHTMNKIYVELLFSFHKNNLDISFLPDMYKVYNLYNDLPNNIKNSEMIYFIYSNLYKYSKIFTKN
jgi:hypothetical protein